MRDAGEQDAAVVPALRGRALLDHALQPLVRAWPGAAHDARCWALLARALRADSGAGVALPPALWLAVARACEPPPAASVAASVAADAAVSDGGEDGVGALAARVHEVLLLHRLRQPPGHAARLAPLEQVAAAAVSAARRAGESGVHSPAWRNVATEAVYSLAHATRGAQHGRKVRACARRASCTCACLSKH
jgi:hypothetical protein